MANTIKLKNSGTSSNVPSSLEYGELAINYADGKLFYKDSGGSIVEFTATASPAGSDGQVQYNNGGAFGGASGLHYDDSNARLGIGTTSPTTALDISQVNPTLTINDTDGVAGGSITSLIQFEASNTVAGEVGLATGAGNMISWAKDGNYYTGTQSADSMFLRTNNLDRLTINSSGNVGIGTTSPAELLHIYEGASGVTSQNGAADLIIESDDQAGIALNTPNTGVGYLRFVDPDNNAQGGLSYAHSTDTLSLRTSGADKVMIDAAGDLSMPGHITVQSGGADSGIVIGQAFSSSYVGLRTAGMSESSGTEYVLISDGNHTFLGAGGSGTTYIRAGSNSSTHQIRVTSGGAFADGNLTVDDYLIIDNSGSYSSPSLYWGSDSNTGFYRHAENSIGVATGGGRRTLWNTDANLYHYSQLLVPNMSTTSSYNTVRWNTSNGHLMRFSSTTDIKEDIVSIAPVLEYLNERSLIHDLRPVLFHEKDNADGTNNTRGEYLAGMIAEEVLEVAPELCYYDYDGNLTSYGIEALIPHLVAEIQRLSPLVEEMYGNANPDWVAPVPRPASRSNDERTRYDEASAAQAEIGLVIPAGFETEEE